MTDREPDPVILALSHVRSRSLGGPLEDVEKGGGNVTLNFHPDRLIGDVPILRALASGGTYRSQFETRTSNGASPPTTEVIGGCGRAGSSATASSSRRISAYQIGTHCPRSPTPTPPSSQRASSTNRSTTTSRPTCTASSTSQLRAHPGYRGIEFVELGVQLAKHGRLTPRIIGDASRTGAYDEQALKRVWHYLARFGYAGSE